MPDIEELFKNKMTWPRLVIKGIVEAVIVYNAYRYATVHKTEDWECYATESKQPNDF